MKKIKDYTYICELVCKSCYDSENLHDCPRIEELDKFIEQLVQSEKNIYEKELGYWNLALVHLDSDTRTGIINFVEEMKRLSALNNQ